MANNDADFASAFVRVQNGREVDAVDKINFVIIAVAAAVCVWRRAGKTNSGKLRDLFDGTETVFNKDQQQQLQQQQLEHQQQEQQQEKQ